MLTERELQISPTVQESVVHNTKVRRLFLSASPQSPAAKMPCGLYAPRLTLTLSMPPSQHCLLNNNNLKLLTSSH